MNAHNAEQAAQAAWITYRDEYQQSRWWLHGNPRRAARQLRKRDFIAGFLAAQHRAGATS